MGDAPGKGILMASIKVHGLVAALIGFFSALAGQDGLGHDATDLSQEHDRVSRRRDASL
jgi:hypothetical protein